MENEKNENINIIGLLGDFYFYKVGVIVIVILTLFLTMIYIQTKTPLYASNILIGIESDDTSSMKILFPHNSVMRGEDMKSKLDYEITLLKSYPIISELLNEIDFFQKVFIKGTWKDKEIFMKKVPFTLNWQSKFKDNEKFQFEFQAFTKNSFYIFFGEKKSLYHYGDPIEIKQYKLKIDTNNIVNTNNRYIIKINYNKEKIIQNIIENISITKKANKLLNITYEDTVAPRIKIFLNKLILTYKKNILERRQGKDYKNILFYDKAIKELEKVLSSLGNKLKTYKSTHSELSMIGSEDKLYVNVLEQKNILSTLSLQLNDLKTTQKRIESGIYSTVLLENSELRTEAFTQLLTKLIKKKSGLERFYKQRENKGLLVISDAEYIQYLNKLQKSKNELRALRVNYTDNYPAVQELKKTIIEEKRALEKYLLNKINLYTKEVHFLKQEVLGIINDLISSTQDKYTSMSKILASNKSSIDSLPKRSMALDDLKRKFKLHEENYKILLKKRSEALISKTSNIVSIDIIETPKIPKKPIKPKKSFLYFSGLIVALFLSILYISIQRHLNQTIQRESDFILNDYQLITYEKDDFQKNLWRLISIFEKSFRSSKVIALSSNEYIENKKDTLIKLALLLESINKKVLIVDFDIYHAIFTNLFDYDEKGLSNILTSKHACSEIDIEHYIVQERREDSNIDFLLSGPLSSNGSRLLFDKKIDALIYILRDKYDYILIDFAPIGRYPVMNVAIKYCDSFLVVAEKGKTDKSLFNKLHKIELETEEKIILFKQ